MTIRELIELLANQDPDLRVMMQDSDDLVSDIDLRQITIETKWLGHRDQNGDKVIETFLQIHYWQ